MQQLERAAESSKREAQDHYRRAMQYRLEGDQQLQAARWNDMMAPLQVNNEMAQWHMQAARWHLRQAQTLYAAATDLEEKAQGYDALRQWQEKQAQQERAAEQESRRQAQQNRQMVQLCARDADRGELFAATRRQEAGGIEDGARWAKEQVPGLRSRSQHNRGLAGQYEAAAHPPAPTSLVVYDHAGIADGVRGLRRVVSQSESALDRIGQEQDLLAANSAGQATAASQEALTQLRKIRRRMIDVAIRALDYLDLADTQIGHLDHTLAQRFFNTTLP